VRHTNRVITFLLVVGLAIGYTTTEGQATEPKHRKESTAQRGKAKPEKKDKAQTKQDLAMAQNAEMVDRMKSELYEIQQDLNRLSATVDRSSGVAKTNAKAKPEVVPDKRAKAKPQLDQAESATESTWDDVKSGFKKSYGELRDSIEKARQWLSDKVEP
jgi:uncharacterized membrane-anchored protein YhcB (DUF1043 family)